jgi:hypothetical protein
VGLALLLSTVEHEGEEQKGGSTKGKGRVVGRANVALCVHKAMPLWACVVTSKARLGVSHYQFAHGDLESHH